MYFMLHVLDLKLDLLVWWVLLGRFRDVDVIPYQIGGYLRKRDDYHGGCDPLVFVCFPTNDWNKEYLFRT